MSALSEALGLLVDTDEAIAARLQEIHRVGFRLVSRDYLEELERRAGVTYGPGDPSPVEQLFGGSNAQESRSPWR